MRKKVIFTGHFGEFFLKALGLLVLTIVTFGIAGVYFAYWNAEYFVRHLEIEA